MENYSTWPALWKIGAFLGSWLILWVPIAIPLGMKLKWKLGQPTTGDRKIPLVSSLYLIAPAIIWGLLRWDNISRDIYRSISGPSLLKGTVIGGAGIIIVYGVEWLLGWLEPHPDKFKSLMMWSLPVGFLCLWLAGTEELIFRGIFLSQLAGDYGAITGSVISAIVFALVHLLWERRETLYQLPGLWLMGMILAIAVFIDGGGIGLAWGLHAGWIWGLGMLDSSGIVSQRSNVSPWWIGFHGSPIAGLAGILCLLATGLGLWGFQ